MPASDELNLQEIEETNCEQPGADTEGGLPQDRDTLNITERQKACDEHQAHLEKVKDITQDREQRKEFAKKIFCLVCSWLGVLTLIIILSGWKMVWSPGGQPFVVLV